MTTSIKLHKDLAGHDKGDTIEVSDEAAARLIERGVATEVSGTIDTSNTDDSDSGAGSDDKPAGNASTEDWAAYAVAHGKTEDELKGLKRDDIKALFEV